MPGKNLTREEARTRADLLTVASYAVTLDLTTGAETFRTRAEVAFDAQGGANSFIDFLGESVQAITLNGESLDPATHFDGSRIELTGLQEHNELTIEATGRYMNTGEGLHRMVDPTDQEVYLYTQFEVADCRRMFPVFEQPDLKATYQFTVTAPARWEVISNQPTPDPVAAPQTYTNVKGEEEPAATWTFEPTERMSCYITALVAGPYDVVRDEVQTRGGTIPLGVYCRKSLRPYLDADNIFDCTKKGFAFFEEEFDQAYPFTKYDQLFTPEYNAGAMENAACVTFAEIYIFRAKVSDALIERRALTILHELAHMWFGDLVTMKWWDDLWLNESFAEWASTTCQAEATQWESAWTTFGTAEKAWAYSQDQLSSTHPIAADITDLEAVEVNFDGITYAKGASVLKQLVAYVGREPFVAGLRTYFAKHKWGNTTLTDLLVELEATSGRDLSQWSKLWLETAGVNTLTPHIETDEAGVITSAVVEQTATEELPTLRPHRLAVGLYALQGDSLVRTESIEVDVDGARTELPALVGKVKGDLLLLNDQDLAYAKIRLDADSLRTALKHPRAFTDSLPRALVLGAAWDMTRDAQLPARDFVRLGLDALQDETDSNLLRALIGQVGAAATRYAAPEHRDALLTEVTKTLRALAVSAQPGSDAQLQLMEAFAGEAHTDDDVAYIRGLLDGTSTLAGLEVDTEMRWTLLTSLAAAGAADDAAVATVQQQDPTATGAERAARARAAMPTSEAKADAWTQVVERDDTPNQTLRAIGVGFQTVHDAELLAPYIERYHDSIAAVWKERTMATAGSIATLMYPSPLASQALLDASERWLSENSTASAGLVRAVAENRDSVRRALRAQAYDAAQA
ncbi:aminopeptidase N [Luteipulveratus mongoliensis]|uniref:Aminopeptidase N n=1 Tax=Luteipulveratus mongoliensis TaxID=571913 RepID=A0A0K1JKY6_9MICO|nr:aminopeptidase N [Luteipulveratus mongoliensis]AKU17387.1 aminopeptidase N [Luteipulveratus mongoliensis]